MSTRGGIAIYTSSSTKMSNSVKVDGDQMFLEEKKFGEVTLPLDIPKHKPRRFVRPVEIPVVDPCSSDLRDAANYIEAHGWCQYAERTMNGRVCASTAIRRAAGRSKERQQKALRRFAKHLGMPVIVYNDYHKRTVGEITAALRACARR
jgi:hypothetical protein